jgi:hypothetical protein
MSYPYSGMVLGGAYLLFVALRRIGGGAWKISPPADPAHAAERAA